MQMSYFWLDKCVTAEVTVVADVGNPKLKIWVQLIAKKKEKVN